MTGPNFTWSDFRGGEWSSYAQGRIDDKDYARALTECSNAIPIEEGALSRRAGTNLLGPSHLGRQAVVRSVDLSDGNVIMCEFSIPGNSSPGLARFWMKPYNGAGYNTAAGAASGIQPVPDSWGQITSIGETSPATATIAIQSGLNYSPNWNSGDVIVAHIDPSTAASNAPQIDNAQLTIADGGQVLPPTLAPTLGETSAGSFTTAICEAVIAWVSGDDLAETGPSPVAQYTTGDGDVLTIAAPSGVPSNAGAYNVYAGAIPQTPPPIPAPGEPTLGSTSGGSIAATTYYVRVTWVNAAGETLGSTETSLAVAADHLLTVEPPSSSTAALSSATGWNVYVSTATGTETKQNSSVLAFDATWTEPTSGLISGSALPSANTTGPTLSSTAGGSIAETTYYVQWIYAQGDNVSLPSAEVSYTVAADHLLVVSGPPAVQGASGWNLYVSTTSGAELGQSPATYIEFGNTWTEPTSGLIDTGGTPPTVSTMAAQFTLQNSEPILVADGWTCPSTGLTMTGNPPNAAGAYFVVWDLYDAATNNPIDNSGGALNFTGGTYTSASHVLTLPIPCLTLADLEAIRLVPLGTGGTLTSNPPMQQALFFCAGYQPLLFSFYNMTWQPIVLSHNAVFVDGPWLDPAPGLSQTGNSIGQVGSTGVMQTLFTITDGAYSFLSTDYGRGIRIWSQPPAWDASTEYTNGQGVTYGGEFWLANMTIPAGTVPSAIANDNGNPYWTFSPSIGQWFSGTIVEVNSDTSSTISLSNYPSGGYGGAGTGIPASNAYNIDTWQLGAYWGDTWPSNGAWHEGRLYLFGAANRIDASTTSPQADLCSGDFLFSPTDYNGNVLDTCGFSYALNSDRAVAILWGMSHQAGLLCGTAEDEWVVGPATLGAPLTPTNVQAGRVSAFGAANAIPAYVNIATIYAQTEGHKVIELYSDPYTTKWVGRHLNEYARHLTQERIIELAYTEEPTPVIWARRADGTLLGCSYRRIQLFVGQPPEFWGWHKHALGSGNTVQSIAKGPQLYTDYGAGYTVGMVTEDSNGIFWIETLRPVFSSEDPLSSNWHLDGGWIPGWKAAPDATPSPPSPINSTCPPPPQPPATAGTKTGKLYFEVQVVSKSGPFYGYPAEAVIGFCTSLFNPADPNDGPYDDRGIDIYGHPLGLDTQSIGLTSNTFEGSCILTFNNVVAGGSGLSTTVGHWYGFCLDLTTAAFSFADLTAGDSVPTPTGGIYSLAGFGVNAILPAVSLCYCSGTNSVKFNFGATPFQGVIPAGYVAYDATGATFMNVEGGNLVTDASQLQVTAPGLWPTSGGNSTLFTARASTGVVLS